MAHGICGLSHTRQHKCLRLYGENLSRRDLVKVAQYEVLGNEAKSHVRPEAFGATPRILQAGKAKKPVQRCFIIAAPAHISDRIGRNCQHPDTKPDNREENSDHRHHHRDRGACHHDHVTESTITENQLWAPKPKPNGAFQFGFSG
jgi:hypothetical protein